MHKYGNSYRAIVCENRLPKYIGSYKSEIEAARAFDAYVMEKKLPQIKALNFSYPNYPSSSKKTKAASRSRCFASSEIYKCRT